MKRHPKLQTTLIDRFGLDPELVDDDDIIHAVDKLAEYCEQLEETNRGHILAAPALAMAIGYSPEPARGGGFIYRAEDMIETALEMRNRLRDFENGLIIIEGGSYAKGADTEGDGVETSDSLI